MKTGIDLIAEERQRQISVEGWTPKHDAEHKEQELAGAAACYAMPEGRRELLNGVPIDFPFGSHWWKPTPKNRVKELVKAGALIAAEIDRIQEYYDQKTISANYNHTKEQQWWDSIKNHAELCIKHNVQAATSCYTIPFVDIQKIYNLEHNTQPTTQQINMENFHCMPDGEQPKSNIENHFDRIIQISPSREQVSLVNSKGEHEIFIRRDVATSWLITNQELGATVTLMDFLAFCKQGLEVGLTKETTLSAALSEFLISKTT